MKLKITNLLSVALFSLVSAPVFSQSFITKWGSSYAMPCGINHNCYDIQTDHSGNHIFTGNIWTSGGLTLDLDRSPTNAFPNPATTYSNDFYVCKYDPAGNFISAFIIGSSGVDLANSIAVDNGNNILVTGYFNGTVDFDPSPTATVNAVSNGGNDIFLAKYTGSGALIWVKTFGGAGSDIGTKVITDAQNNVFMTANFSGTMDIDPSAVTNNLISLGNTDVCIARFDPNGNLLVATSFGNTGAEAASDIVIDGNKKIYVTGTFNGTVDFDPHPVNSYTLTNTSGPGDIFICRFDSLMTYDWAKSLVSVNTIGANDINLDNNGNILLCGYFNFQPIDLDPSPTSTIMVAMSNTVSESSFIAKYDNNGNYLWAGGFGGGTLIDGNKATSIWSDNSGNVYSTGFYTGTPDFDFSASSYTVAGHPNGPSLYYSKYSPAGVIVSAQRMSQQSLNSLASHVDANGDILFAGRSFGAVNIDPTGANPYTLAFPNQCGNYYNAFACKYTTCNLPVINTLTTSANNLCPTVPLTLSVNGSLNSSADWSWSRGSCAGTSLGTGASIVVTPTASGLYYVKGIGGCAGSVLGCTSISITTQPAPTLQLTSSAALTVCPAVNFTLTAGGAPTYTWSTGATLTAISASISASSIYSVSTTGNTGCVITKTLAITIFSVEPLTRTPIGAQDPDITCPGGNHSIKLSGGSQFNWQFLNCICAPTFTNNETEVYLTFVNLYGAGERTYTVTSKDVNGCDNSQTYTLTIDACTGINQLSSIKNNIQVYPSPAGTTLWVETPVAITKLRIINIAGQVLNETVITGNEAKHALNTSELKPGIYVLEIYNNTGLVESRKIIKE